MKKIKEEFLKMLPPMTTASVAVAALVLWPHFWALQIVLFLLILLYVTTTEMSRVLGRDRLRRIFFGPLPLSAA